MGSAITPAASSGCDSRTAACQAARGCPAASRLCTPCCKSLKRSSGSTALRPAAKYRSLDSWKRPCPSARLAPRDRSATLASGNASRRASSWSCTSSASSACWLAGAPIAARSSAAVMIDANTRAGVLTVPMLRLRRASSSVAASRWWSSRPRILAWRSRACHQARSHWSQACWFAAEVPAKVCASVKVRRAPSRSPRAISFSTSSSRSPRSLGSVRRMLRR